MILNATILNQRFILHEVRDSVVETTITDQINGGLQRYGIPVTILTDKDTDRLPTQAVDQVYAGRHIHLDLSNVTQRAGATADNELAQYGLPGVAGAASSAIGTSVSDAVNSQLNTPVVTRLATGIHLARVIANLTLTVTGIGLVAMMVLATWGHHLTRSFSRIGCGAGIIVGILCGLVGKLVPQLAADQPDYAAFVAQLATDFMRAAFSAVGFVLIISILLFIWRLVGGRWLSRRHA